MLKRVSHTFLNPKIYSKSIVTHVDVNVRARIPSMNSSWDFENHSIGDPEPEHLYACQLAPSPDQVDSQLSELWCPTKMIHAQRNDRKRIKCLFFSEIKESLC